MSDSDAAVLRQYEEGLSAGATLRALMERSPEEAEAFMKGLRDQFGETDEKYSGFRCLLQCAVNFCYRFTERSQNFEKRRTRVESNVPAPAE